VKLSSHDPVGAIYDAEGTAEHVYVADNVTGLQILDIRDPAAPVLVAEHGDIYAYDMAISEPYLYVANTNGLDVYDIGDPTAPELLGSAGNIGIARVVNVQADLAYLQTDSTGFQVVDITDRRRPVPLGSSPAGSVRDIAVAGNYAYLVNIDGLVTMDVTDPSAPFPSAVHRSRNKAVGIDVSGNYLYVANFTLAWVEESGIWLYDISDPAHPSLAEIYRTPGIAYDVVVSGQDVLVVDNYGFLVLAARLGYGDVNGDGEVTGTDVVYLVDYLFRAGPEPVPTVFEGDADCSGEVTLLDVIFLVNYLYRDGPAPC